MTGLTNGNDRYNGTNANEYVRGLNGNDTIYGEGGNDSLQGDGGKDSLYGGVGIDRLLGGEGDDLLDGGQGWDSLYGGNGNDTIIDRSATPFQLSFISGGDGNDTIITDDGGVQIWGGRGIDKISLLDGDGYESYLYYNQGDTPVRETVKGFHDSDGDTLFFRETDGAALSLQDITNGTSVNYGNVHILLEGYHGYVEIDFI